MPQVRSVIATKVFHTFYDAEASALAAVSGGRRCEDPERRKIFTTFYDAEASALATAAAGRRRTAAGRRRRTAAGRGTAANGEG